MLSNLILLSLLGPLPQDPGLLDPVPREETIIEVAEDIEVLRRLLVRGIDAVLAPDDSDANARVQVTTGFFRMAGSSGSNIGHARGFYVPGGGAFYSLDVTVPAIAVPERTADPDQPRAADDEWSQIEREVRRGETTSSGPTGVAARGTTVLSSLAGQAARPFELDPEAIDLVEHAALETIARHAKNIEGLRPGEFVTVALRLKANNNPLTSFVGSGLGTQEIDWNNWVSTNASSRAPDKNLVIRVRAGSLAQLRDPDDVRADAGNRITLY